MGMGSRCHFWCWGSSGCACLQRAFPFGSKIKIKSSTQRPRRKKERTQRTRNRRIPAPNKRVPPPSRGRRGGGCDSRITSHESRVANHDRGTDPHPGPFVEGQDFFGVARGVRSNVDFAFSAFSFFSLPSLRLRFSLSERTPP